MSNDEFVIEKGVPIPVGAGRRGGPRKYPWWDMEVGDSVFIPDMKMHTLSHSYARAPGKFAARTEGNGVRVWRIA